MPRRTNEFRLDERDPNGMNRYLQIEYDDIFGEPVGAYSMDWYSSILNYFVVFLNFYFILIY
jgi:hypothetical protein